MRFSAALAYYAIFSMAPLVIIAVSAAGLFFGEQAARGEIFQQIERLISPKAAVEIQSIIQASSSKPKSALATIIGLATLIIGASGVFAQLKDALNAIWGVRLTKSAGIKSMIKDYALSFSIVLNIGFLLIISLLFGAALQAISTYMKGVVPLPPFAAPLAEADLIRFAHGSLCAHLQSVAGCRNRLARCLDRRGFHIDFSYDRKVSHRLYLGTSSVASSFGAAGALILILTWVCYSTTIFLFGAEFTEVFAREFGCGIVPSRHADVIMKEVREEQGLGKHPARPLRSG